MSESGTLAHSAFEGLDATTRVVEKALCIVPRCSIQLVLPPTIDEDMTHLLLKDSLLGL
jgi:hypothetical protein